MVGKVTTQGKAHTKRRQDNEQYIVRHGNVKGMVR